MGFLFLGKGSTAYEIYPNQMVVLWNTLGGFIWDHQNIFTCSARTKTAFQNCAGFEPHEISSWGYILLCLPLQESAQYHYMRQIQGNRLGFQFCCFWDRDKVREKMGKCELQQPYMDFLCHTMIRTVAPGVPPIYHLLFSENYRADGSGFYLDYFISPLHCSREMDPDRVDAEKNEGYTDSGEDNLPC